MGVYLRSKLADTPAFLALEKESEDREKENKVSGEFKAIFRLWPNLLACVGLVLAWNVTNYMLTAYMPTYLAKLPDYQGGASVSATTSQVLQIIVMAVLLVIIPLVGRLSDRVGRKIIVRVGSAFLVMLSIPAILVDAMATEAA